MVAGVGILRSNFCPSHEGAEVLTPWDLVYASVGGEVYGVHPEVYFAERDPMAYMPLAVGNRWVYGYSRSTLSAPGQNTTTHRLLEYFVTGHDSTTKRATVRVRSRPPGEEGEWGEPYACQIWPDPAGRIRFEGCSLSVLSESWVPTAPWSHRLYGRAVEGPYEIGGTSYPLPVLSFFWTLPLDGGPYDNHAWYRYRGAHGVGQPYSEYYFFQQGSGQPPSGIRFTLLYAKIGEETYGTPPVSTEAHTPAATALGATVHPNPARAAATLTVTLPAGADLTAEVYDVLGRLRLALPLGPTAAGETVHALPLAGLPAGPYVVVVRGASGERAVVRLTVGH